MSYMARARPALGAPDDAALCALQPDLLQRVAGCSGGRARPPASYV